MESGKVGGGGDAQPGGVGARQAGEVIHEGLRIKHLDPLPPQQPLYQADIKADGQLVKVQHPAAAVAVHRRVAAPAGQLHPAAAVGAAQEDVAHLWRAHQGLYDGGRLALAALAHREVGAASGHTADFVPGPAAHEVPHSACKTRQGLLGVHVVRKPGHKAQLGLGKLGGIEIVLVAAQRQGRRGLPRAWRHRGGVWGGIEGETGHLVPAGCVCVLHG